MAIEDFKNLIEAQSLDKRIKDHLDLIEEQKRRILHIEGQRNKASIKLDNLKADGDKLNQKLSSSEKELFQAESKMERTKEHIPMARSEQETIALENELKVLTPLVDKLQEDILDFMEKVEIADSELTQLEEYLQGSLNSLNEIKQEADEITKKENDHILTLEERIKTLLNQTDDIYRDAFISANKKHRFNNPLCFVQNHACHVCRFTLNQMQANEIEKANTTDSCPGCARLLTPLSAKNI